MTTSNADLQEGWLASLSLVVVTSASPGHRKVAASALRAGCRAIQLRDKELSDREFAEVARIVQSDCDLVGALFFINDRVDVALALGCDGVHLGVDDLAVSDAMELLEPGVILGYSPETLEGAKQAVEDGADYLGVGPVFATPSKEDAGEPIGLAGLATYCEAGLVPVIAVGGINENSAAEAIAAGAAGVAVSSAVAGAQDMESATRMILERVEAAAQLANRKDSGENDER